MAERLWQPAQPRLVVPIGALQWGCSPPSGVSGRRITGHAPPCQLEFLRQPGAKSGDNSTAALARVELLLRWWSLRTAFAARAALGIRTTLTARAAGAKTTGSAAPWATWAPRRPHLFQLR